MYSSFHTLRSLSNLSNLSLNKNNNNNNNNNNNVAAQRQPAKHADYRRRLRGQQQTGIPSYRAGNSNKTGHGAGGRRRRDSQHQQQTGSRLSIAMDMHASGDSHPVDMATIRAGLQSEYLQSLDYLRGLIAELESQVARLKRTFYQCEENDDVMYEAYLKKNNDWFLHANNLLRKKNIPLKVIDGEMRLVEMLNHLRDQETVDAECINILTDFWQTLKSACESLAAIMANFQLNVHERLKNNCLSYNSSDINLDVSSRYTDEIYAYLQGIEKIVTNTQLLLKSCHSGLQQDLFTNTNFSERVLVCCDQKAFPVLRFVPDMTEKIESLCRIGRQWLDRDETYVYEINNFIRETRSITRKCEEDLRNQKEKHKKVVKSVKAAYILCQNNKQKLHKLESELNVLEDQLNGCRQQKKCKGNEKGQKEDMADFLKISITQTRKNYGLQLKRSKLLRQVKELEHYLGELEKELSNIRDEIECKSQQKLVIAEKVETTKKSYSALKTELEKFTHFVSKLETDVTDLSDQLLQLEIIHTIKTSPEKLDDMYSRPSSVKLAPSLKEKIKQRKRKLMANHKT